MAGPAQVTTSAERKNIETRIGPIQASQNTEAAEPVLSRKWSGQIQRMQSSGLLRSDADRIKIVVQYLPDPASRLPRTAQRWPEMMVGVAGFEPATPASRTQC